MPLFNKTVFTGFAPNLTFRDVKISLKYLLLPWKWRELKTGKFTGLAEKKIKDYFPINHAFVFDSGRSALCFAIKALGAGQGDEVLVQAYTCVVVINAIKWAGAKPVFLDIDDSFNIKADDLVKKISKNAKILIIQHTFGLAAEMDKLLEIAKNNNLKIIEDCAHALGAESQGQRLGTFGDIGVLSFGADKIISCARGGALITGDKILAQSIKKFQSELPLPKTKTLLSHLASFPVFFISKPLYHLIIGKMLLLLAKISGLTNKIIYKSEKGGMPTIFFPSTLANSLADILVGQLDEIAVLNKHRQRLAGYYYKNIKNDKLKLIDKNKAVGSVFLRFPILTNEPDKLRKYAKKKNIILGDWYNGVVAPSDIDSTLTGYRAGDCPKAELLAGLSLNLPTDRNISTETAKKIIKIINSY